MQREHRVIWIVAEPVVDRLGERIPLPIPVHLGVGEIRIVLERFDVDLGEQVRAPRA
jgi:hypothetical protein